MENLTSNLPNHQRPCLQLFYWLLHRAAEILALFPKFGRASKRERSRRGENSASIGEEELRQAKKKGLFPSTKIRENHF